MKTYFLWVATALIILTGCDGIGINLGQKDWFPTYEEQAYGRAIYAFARPDKPKVDVYDRVDLVDVNPEEGQPTPAPAKPQGYVPPPPRELLAQAPASQAPVTRAPIPTGIPFWAEMDSAEWCVHCKTWLNGAKSNLPLFKVVEISHDSAGSEIVDESAHIRVRKHGKEYSQALPRFTFYYRRPSDGAVIPIGNVVVGAVDFKSFQAIWKLRVMEAERYDRTGWPTMESHGKGSDIWDSIADHVTVALAPNMKVRAAPGALPTTPQAFFEQMSMLLGGGTVTLSDGVSAQTGTSLTLNLRREGDAIIGSFQGQKPKVTVKKFINITTTLDGFTVTSGGARVHLGNVPQFLEPTFEFPK